MADEDDLIRQAAGLSTATLHEALGRIGALPCRIKPVAPGMRLAGRAFPLRAPGGHNLMLHKALYEAEAGDILVADISEAHDYGYWGEILSEAALARNLGGLVIDGCVRDSAELARLGFPVFARGLCIKGTGKAPEGELNIPVTLGEVTVEPGDIVIGDADGVMAIPAGRLEEAVAAGRARDEKEADIIEELRAGKTSLEIYGFET